MIEFLFQGDNNLTKKLLDRLQARKKIYLIAGKYQDKLIARFVIGSRLCQKEDITFAWNEISDQTTEILQVYETSIDKITNLMNNIKKDITKRKTF